LNSPPAERRLAHRLVGVSNAVRISTSAGEIELERLMETPRSLVRCKHYRSFSLNVIVICLRNPRVHHTPADLIVIDYTTLTIIFLASHPVLWTDGSCIYLELLFLRAGYLFVTFFLMKMNTVYQFGSDRLQFVRKLEQRSEGRTCY